MKNNSWFSFIAGAIVGAGLTWLFTSKEGKELMENIKEKGNDLKANAEEELEKLKEKLSNFQQDNN